MKTWRTESDGGTSENRWRDRHRAVGPWTEDKAEAEADAEHGSMRGALQLSDMSEPNDECVTDPEEHSHCARGTYGCGTDHSVWLAWRNEKDRRPQEAPARTAPVLAKDGVTRMHYLKCWPMPLRDVISGAKPFEYRKHDRDYRVGDVLVLEEWEPNKAAYVQGGLATSRVVTYFLPGGTFGVPGDTASWASLRGRKAHAWTILRSIAPRSKPASRRPRASKPASVARKSCTISHGGAAIAD